MDFGGPMAWYGMVTPAGMAWYGKGVLAGVERAEGASCPVPIGAGGNPAGGNPPVTIRTGAGETLELT